MKKMFLAVMLACAPLALTACDFGTVQSPGSVANTTVLDEKLAIGAELAFKGARTAAEVAVDAGLLKGAKAAQVNVAREKAYAAVQAVRQAYQAGNASTYSDLAEKAQTAVAEFLSAIK